MSNCSRCGSEFACGMVDGDANEPCWCTKLPILPAEALTPARESPDLQSCLCPVCLKSKIEALRHTVD